MKKNSSRIDATDLGPAEASPAGNLPIELKPGVMGTVLIRMLSGRGPLGRRRGARFSAEGEPEGGLLAGFGEEEEEDFEEEEDEDFDEEDEFGDEEDDDFDEEDDEEESEEEEDELEEDEDEDGEEDLDEEDEEEFDDEE